MVWVHQVRMDWLSFYFPNDPRLDTRSIKHRLWGSAATAKHKRNHFKHEAVTSSCTGVGRTNSPGQSFIVQRRSILRGLMRELLTLLQHHPHQLWHGSLPLSASLLQLPTLRLKVAFSHHNFKIPASVTYFLLYYFHFCLIFIVRKVYDKYFALAEVEILIV